MHRPRVWFPQRYCPKTKWCRSDQPGYDVYLPTGEGIGSGASNTNLIIEKCGSATGFAYAAGLAAAYRGGDKSDWFLPSLDELAKMCDRRSEVGGLSEDSYWSSSQKDNFSYNASYVFFGNCGRLSDAKDDGAFVRPVRAF